MIDLLVQYIASAEMANNQGFVLQLTIYFSLDICIQNNYFNFFEQHIIAL